MGWRTITYDSYHSLEQNYINEDRLDYFIFYYNGPEASEPYNTEFLSNDYDEAMKMYKQKAMSRKDAS